jgi:hypothetical protein
MMSSVHTLTLSAVLLSQICSSTAQLRRNPKIKSIRQLESDQCATEAPTVGDAFTSFLEVVYEVSHEIEDPEMYASIVGTGEFDGPVQALLPSYNGLIAEFDDPFSRRIADIQILSLADADQELNRDRKLQGFRARFALLLQIGGRCSFCSSDSTLSNQISGRRRLATGGADKGPASPKGSKGGGYGEDPESDDEASTSYSGSKSCGKGKGGCLRPGLPTEEEIQTTYDDDLQTLHFDTVVGVVDLAEVTYCPPTESSSTSASKSGKKSSKKSGRGGKGGKKGSKRGTGGSKGGKKGSEGARSYPVTGDTHVQVGVTDPAHATKGSKGKGKAGY